MSHGSSPLDKLHLPWKRKHHGKDSDSEEASSAEKEPLTTTTTTTNKPTTPPSSPVISTTPVSSPSRKKTKETILGSFALGNERVSRIWEVKMPPAKKTMVHGVLVPTMMGGTLGSKLIQRRRRIAIEIHSENDDALDTTRMDDAAMTNLLRGDSFQGDSTTTTTTTQDDSLHVGERVVIRILKPVAKGEDSDDDDHRTLPSISTLGFRAADEEEEWVTNYVLGLDDVEILKSRGSHCEMKIGHGSDTQVRHVNFTNERDLKSFQQVLEKLFNLKHKLTEQRVREFRELAPVMADEGGTNEIRLLIEIVSGIGLPATDINSTDAYVIVRLSGSKEVHRTTPVYGTLNPIWTIASGSLFLLKVSPEEFFDSSQGLTFIVKDWDQMSANDTLGKVFVTQEELLKGNGEREEHSLMESASDNPKRPGKLVLRYRKATDQDEIFMERLNNNIKNNVKGVYGDETFVQPHVSTSKFLHREHRKEKTGTDIQHRVKPGPDPDRPEQATKWMTTSEIDAESLKPSSKWIEAGSGDLGKLYVEIIGCDGLPNMDTAAMGGGKTDAFCCLVYEDSIVNTEVINDVLSPRWMPWTQRAFIFNVMHMSNDLMVGVLDYDSPAPMAIHDPIGRAEIDITNLRPGTEYTLTYELYTSAIVKKRKPKGSIKVRVRLELDDQRKAVLSSMHPPPQIYVNVATYRDYRVALFVIEGKYDVHSFNMDLLAEYVEELKVTGLGLLPIVKNAAYTVVLWRGHHPLSLRVFRCPPLPRGDNVSVWNRFTKSITILLPLHSVVAFAGAVLLVEDYNFFPSFLLFSVGWLFLATSGHINDHPSPWHHPRSFPELARAFVSGTSPSLAIEPNENLKAVQDYAAKKAEDEKKIQEEAEKRAKEQAKEQEVVGDLESAKGAEVDMRTNTGGGLAGVVKVNVNPLKPILYPMQINLQKACQIKRICKSFLVWEESYYCFWVVVSSIVGGLLLLFIPWGWLIRWIFRILVWTFLGPWMKLVDIFYVKRVISSEEEQEAAEARMKARYEALMDSARHSQTQKEELTKLKVVKEYMYGEFIAPIPRFKQQRYLDLPLAPSYAFPHVAGATYNITCRKYGQHLSGDMIPKREIDGSEESSPLQGTKVKLYGTTGTF